jgi:hypothetical protein
MRLSSLSLAAVLLFSSIAFAQHHEAGSAPSAPPPSPPPAAAPSPAPAPPPPPPPAPSPAPSFSPPAPSVSHSAPSPAPAPSIPESHVAPTPSPALGPSPAPGAASGAARSGPSSDKTPIAHTPEPGRVVPAQKISGEDRVEAAPRIGEHPQEKDRLAKPADPDLRRRACEGEACKEPVAKPVPPESDLRRRICVNGSCGCPAGQTASKNGCVTTVVSTPETPCQPGMAWNGAACAPNGSGCRAGQTWNGVSCQQDCATFEARAAAIKHSVWVARTQRDEACKNGSTTADCSSAQGSYDFEVGRYRTLQNEAAPECSAMLAADPTSF